MTDGFQIGSNTTVNEGGANFFYAAFNPTPINYRSIGTAPAYTTGDVTATLGSTIVTGTGAWVGANRGRGDHIDINGNQYTILSVDSETQLTLTSPAIATYTGPLYTISRQFGTLAAWEQCISGGAGCTFFPVATGNLVGENRSEVGIAYDDGATFARVTIDGSITDANHTITLTVDPGNRHTGRAGNGVVLNNGAALAAAISVEDEYVAVEWFEVRGGGAGAHGIEICSVLASNQLVLRNNLVHNVPGNAFRLRDANANIDLYNNIIYAADIGMRLDGTPAVVRVFNNTVYNCPNGGINGGGASTVTVRNNISHSNAGGDFDVPGLNAASSNNLASDGTGTTHSPAGGGIDSVPLSGPLGVNFVSTVVGSEDLHITIASRAVGAATDLSSIFDVDIDGFARQPPWEIGADELYGTGSPTHYRSIGTAGSYSTGDVTATLGSAIVTGTGAWVTANRGRGDHIDINGDEYTILSVDSEMQLRLTSPAIATYTGPLYTISRQFTSLATGLQDWEDCIDNTAVCPYFPASVSSSNLVADNRSEVGIVYNDGIFTSGVRIDGTTDASHTITLTADDGNRHYGVPGTGVVVTIGAGAAIDVRSDFVTVEWLELVNGGRGITFTGIGATNKQIIRNNLLHDSSSEAIRVGVATQTIEIYNNIIYNASICIDFILAVTQGDVLNNTAYNCATAGIRGVDAGGSYSTVTLRNNIAYNSGQDFDFDPGGGPTISAASSNDLGSDGTGVPHSPAGGGIDTLQSAFVMFVNPVANDLHILPGSDAENNGADLSGTFSSDIDGGGRQTPWDIGADDILATTAVELTSFTAQPLDGAVELRWETGSELDNLGFHLYRSPTDAGPYEQITARVIPGLGSSPEGATYAYRDASLTNGETYYYKLEDIETTGKTELHGPVSATPEAEASFGGGDTDDSSSHQDNTTSLARITYGDPSANSLKVVSRGGRQVVLELVTQGFYAEPGSVRVDIPGFEALTEVNRPGIPVKRSWVEAVAGRKVNLVSVTARGVEAFTSLRPSNAEVAEIVATPEGTIRTARRRARKVFRVEGLYPSSGARIVSVGFQGDVKKALVELAPLRWDGARGQLLLARRLVVRLSFQGRDLDERSTNGAGGRRYRQRRSHDNRRVMARLATTKRGLHALRYEDVFRAGRGVRASSLRLSRQGEVVALHLEPNANRFEPGPVLYFVSEGASANPFGGEAVYELEVDAPGEAMASLSAAPSGEPKPFYWHRAEWEENRYYQAALVEAPDLWLWDLLFAPEVKSYPVEVSSLAPGSDTSKLSVWLQGVSDFRAAPDHHVRVYVNGSFVKELSWDGKQAQKLEVDLVPGLLREGDNVLQLENVGDTEAAYSMVMLDRYAVEYPRVAVTADGRLQGRWSDSGTAELSGLAPGTHILDTSEAQPRWLVGTEVGTDGMVRFRAESGRSYLVVSPEAVYHPAVTMPKASRLKDTRHRADYLVIGPEAFLQAAIPLLELRQSEGLKVETVAIEEIYSEFGFGEPTPEAVKDFLSYAYHNWRQPSPRYVLLLGDATFDFKDHLQTGVTNQVPPRMVKTSYLWTASDPSYAAVNGDDLLPDLAIGRLPAATVEQVRAMVEKIVAYEAGEVGLHRSAVVLVADNADGAGNFEADADKLAAKVLASKNPEKIYLSQLGPAATRNSILQRFDEGASLVSYMGHGGIHLWASENFFNGSDVASLGPQSQQPLVLTMNCLNGYFHFPYFNSLAEELLKAEGKGAIAAFSPSGLSLNEPAQRLHRAVLQELFRGNHERLGDAMLAGQAVYTASRAFPELLSIYHLMGDPALTLR